MAAVRRSALIAMSIGLILSRLSAEGVTAGEYQVKAAFLTHFAQFIDWPPNALPGKAPFVIAVIGDDPFGGTLDDVAGSVRPNGHTVIIRRLRWNDSLAGCQIAFVGSSELPHLDAILENARAMSVLTVGELDRFVERGGMVELLTVNNRVRFDINAAAASAAHLRISSKLLQLARQVR